MKRVQARKCIGEFVRYTQRNFVEEDFHKNLFDALDKVESGEIKRLMVFMPPRSGKSELIAKRLPAYFLGKYPTKNIVCASYGSELATKHGRESKMITQDEKYKKIFPKFKLSDDKKEGGNWETDQGGGYYAVGIGGGLTGRGFDIGIIDDVVKDRQDAESLTIRDSTWDWYTSTFLTRQQGSNSAIIVMMTRWNVDDLAGRILEGDEQWEIISYPALTDDNQPLVKNRPGYGLEFYEAQRDAIGVRDFAALYQQDPIGSTGNVFNKEDFRYFSLSDLNPNDFTVAVHVDPAFSSRDDSDDTAIMVVARHKQTKELYVLDILAEPIVPSQAFEFIITAAERWNKWGTLDFISIEEVSISADQRNFTRSFQDLCRSYGKFYTTLSFNPSSRGKKEDRIKYSLEPYLNRHAIYFRCDNTANKAWLKLEEQLLRFPAARHDDVADVLSQAVFMWQDRGLTQGAQNVAMEKYTTQAWTTNNSNMAMNRYK